MTNHNPRNMSIAVPSGSGEREDPTTANGTSTPQYSKDLTSLNWLNLIAFVINVIITYGVGAAGWIGNGSNSQLSEKYQTLVTPNGAAFSIWAIIFLSQGVFSVVQLLPSFRQLPLVQNGVGYNYIAACLFQAGWTIIFAYEIIGLSAIFIAAIWLSLVRLVIAQYYCMANGTWLEFFFLRFPFEIHCGWLAAATAVNANLVLVNQGVSASNQLAAGILSLAILHAISVWVTFALHRPNYTQAFVLAWANYWIHVELNSPLESISGRFSADTIQGVSGAAQGVAIVILLQVAARFLWDSTKNLMPLEVFETHKSSLIHWPATATNETTARTFDPTAAPPSRAF